MKKATNKKVTMDDLAGMVAKGFERVDERFDKVEDRLGKVEDKLGKVEENLATTRMDVLGIGDRFVSKHEFNQHLIRFSLLEEKVTCPPLPNRPHGQSGDGRRETKK